MLSSDILSAKVRWHRFFFSGGTRVGREQAPGGFVCVPAFVEATGPDSDPWFLPFLMPGCVWQGVKTNGVGNVVRLLWVC